MRSIATTKKTDRAKCVLAVATPDKLCFFAGFVAVDCFLFNQSPLASRSDFQFSHSFLHTLVTSIFFNVAATIDRQRQKKEKEAIQFLVTFPFFC